MEIMRSGVGGAVVPSRMRTYLINADMMVVVLLSLYEG